MLYPFSGLKHIYPEIVAHAAARGTKVHKICEGIVLDLGEIGVDDETSGYVESFKKWYNDQADIIEIEKRFWDDDLQITGQIDFIANTSEGTAVIDLKTSYNPSKTWPIQGAAYAYLAKKAAYNIKKIYFIHLNKYGKSPHLYEYPVDDELFLSVLRTYNHFYHKCERKNHSKGANGK